MPPWTANPCDLDRVQIDRKAKGGNEGEAAHARQRTLSRRGRKNWEGSASKRFLLPAVPGSPN